MNKLISIMLIAVLLLSLLGCNKKQDTIFYYLRAEIIYGTEDGVIAPEARELSGTEYDLEYLLKLYLEGPISQDLRSPFPKGTALESVVQKEDTLVVTLSAPLSSLENLDYTIACACIASTCFSLCDAETVTICADETEMTLTRENFVLDNQAATIPE